MAGLAPRTWYNIGRNGKSWTVLMSGDSQIESQAIRHGVKMHGSQPVILVLNGGQTDILPTSFFGENQTGAAAYADLIAYCTAARSYGADRIIVTTMCPAQAIYIDPQDPARLAYNALVMAGNAVYDEVVDLANTPGLTNPNDATKYSDGLHFTQAGAGVAAGAVRPVLAAAIAELS